ncbi:PAS domain-containing sensor histidine kinase [Aridibaculum aurantiacum]|uniref:PAS domain-containing sensor histidine kinase n=1 Tax=Aridibaculum aurantiacum TaxID=2810307 RepID=UPI001A9612A7|nr:PAS domain-containing sensor histidine kinase [Aridibaculum aurantiacum]
MISHEISYTSPAFNPVGLFEAIYNQTNDAILVADDKGRYVHVNPAATKILGYTKEEFLSKSTSDLILDVHPDVVVVESWSSFLHKGQQSGVVELKKKNGGIAICHYNASANILPGAHVSILTDITAREQVKREAEEKGKKVEAILERITDCFFSVDKNWVVTYWNKATEQLLGKKREEVLGKVIWDVYQDATNLYLYKQYYKAMHEQVTLHFEDYYPTLELWGAISVYPSPEGLSIYFKDITNCKTSQLELLETKTNYATLINSSYERVWSVSKDLKLILANNAYKEYIHSITGVAPNVGDNVLLVEFGEEQVNKWRTRYLTVLAGNTLQFEEEFLNPVTNKEEYVELSLHPIIAPDGKEITGIACTSRDITARKNNEKLIQIQTRKLEESGRYVERVFRELKNIMDSSLDVICSTDSKGRFLQKSAACKKLWGYEPAELLGLPYLDLVHPDDIEKTNMMAERILGGESVFDFENRFIRKDGSIVNLVWSARWDEKQMTMFSVAKDATSMVEAKRVKAESENRFSALVENSIDVITIMDENFIYKYESPSIYQITGYKPEELISTSAVAHVHPDDVNEAINQIRSLKADGETVFLTYRLKTVTGDWKWFEAYIARHLDNPSIKGYVVNKRDTTQRREYEIVIEKQNRYLKDQAYQLNQLAKKLKRIMDFSVDTICTIDKDQKFVQVSEAALEMWGYPPEELIGTAYMDYVADDFKEITIAAAKEIISGSDVTNFQNVYIHKDGSRVPVIWSATWDPEENLMYCIAKDATAILESENIKYETEKKYSTLLQKGSDVVSIIDRNANFIFVSSNLERIFGMKPEELLGNNSFERLHKDDVEIVKEELYQLLNFSNTRSTVVRFLDANNKYRWIEIIGRNLLDDPAIKGIVLNSRDITDRINKDRELRSANERFELVLEATNEVIYDWNLASGEIYWNSNFPQVFGYTQSHITDFEFRKSCVHPEDQPRVFDSLYKILSSKHKNRWQEEYRMIRQDGSIAHVFEHGYLQVDENKEPIRFVGAIRDITEQITKQQERELIIKELTKSNSDLKQFSFITSHNLRAPLSNIIGILSILDKTKLDDENFNLINLLEQAAAQLNQTLDDLGRILLIRNNSNVEIAKLSVPKVFSDVKKVFFISLKEIGASINDDFLVEEIMFNSAYLESIFLNLFSNSIKYRSTKRPLTINVSTHNSADFTTITWEDNGTGFNLDKYKDRVCGMYQRFHDGIEGKGLGLFIMKSQVTSLGGKMEIDSEVDKGTRFVIYIKRIHDHR